MERLDKLDFPLMRLLFGDIRAFEKARMSREVAHVQLQICTLDLAGMRINHLIGGSPECGYSKKAGSVVDFGAEHTRGRGVSQ